MHLAPKAAFEAAPASFAKSQRIYGINNIVVVPHTPPLSATASPCLPPPGWSSRPFPILDRRTDRARRPL